MRFKDMKIGAKNQCFIIAEIAQAHDGSLGSAHAYIDAVAKTGANAIKFQTHIADEESSKDEPWRVKFSYQDDTRFEYWKRMEFSEAQWIELKKHTEQAGLVFISSPFCVKAVEFLDVIGMKLWKVASGEVNSLFLLDAMIKTKKPIILSSGMSYEHELDERIQYLRDNDVDFALMECTSSYPSQPEQIAIRQIPKYINKYNCPVGLSDHSGTIYPSIAAVVVGASIIEVHTTFSKQMFGPDVGSSVTIEELQSLVEGVRFTEKMMKANVVKDETTKDIEELRKIFGKGIMAKTDIKKGKSICMEDMAFVKPANGINSEEYKNVVGKKAKLDIPGKTFITYDMLEDI